MITKFKHKLGSWNNMLKKNEFIFRNVSFCFQSKIPKSNDNSFFPWRARAVFLGLKSADSSTGKQICLHSHAYASLQAKALRDSLVWRLWLVLNSIKEAAVHWIGLYSGLPLIIPFQWGKRMTLFRNAEVPQGLEEINKCHSKLLPEHV